MTVKNQDMFSRTGMPEVGGIGRGRSRNGGAEKFGKVLSPVVTFVTLGPNSFVLFVFFFDHFTINNHSCLIQTCEES